MSLDSDALAALAGAAALGFEEARLILDETRACAEDIDDTQLRPVWSLFEQRVRSRHGLDAAVVRESLKAEPEAIRNLALECIRRPSLGTARERLSMLRAQGIRRRLLEQLREVATAVKGGKSIADLDAMVRGLPASLQGTSGRVRNARGDALAMRDKLEARWAGKTRPGLVTGFPALDEVLCGLINNLHVIGARAGVGKSALVAGLVANWLEANVRVGVLAYEDDAQDMAARIVSWKSATGLREVRADRMPLGHGQEVEERKAVICDGLAWYSTKEHLLEVDDARPSGTAADVIASIRTMVSRGSQVVVLDNMTCVRLDGAERFDLVLERALSDIRAEAQALHVPIIIIGHLKRGQTDADESKKPPKLSDFSNATAWENYARVAMGMWRDGDGIALRVLKQTNGPAGDTFDVKFRRESALVTGLSLRTYQQQAAKPRRTMREDE